MKTALIAAIKLYQWLLKPVLGPHCRFYPSCSDYAVQALGRHRLIRALGLIVWRLGRCHPWHPGGIDPVPPHTGAGRGSVRNAPRIRPENEDGQPCRM